jgi:hypothetical protein
MSKGPKCALCRAAPAVYSVKNWPFLLCRECALNGLDLGKVSIPDLVSLEEHPHEDHQS